MQTLVRYALGVDAGDILGRVEGIVSTVSTVIYGEKLILMSSSESPSRN